ncbi:MAG: YjbQ family protein, partial [Candidatus Limnocylindria bacterium]
MKTRELSIETGLAPVLVDLADECVAFLTDVADGGDGLLTVFVPHATAAIVVVEIGAGSDEDLLAALERLLPHDERWRHRHGSPGHGADHVLPL